jgi:small GTP-binding protein
VGDTGVGKTSVINSLLNRFSLGNSSTIGASFYRYNDTINKINLDLWDTAGQERFRSIVPLYYKNANIYLIVFDITQKKTLKNIKDWISNIQKYDPIWSKKKIIIIGNKSDLINNFDEEKQRIKDLKILEKPQLNSKRKSDLSKHFITDNIYDTFQDSDAIVILTEWPEFSKINWEIAYKKMRRPAWVFDSRSIVNSEEVLKANLKLWRIGDGS